MVHTFHPEPPVPDDWHRLTIPLAWLNPPTARVPGHIRICLQRDHQGFSGIRRVTASSRLDRLTYPDIGPIVRSCHHQLKQVLLRDPERPRGIFGFSGMTTRQRRWIHVQLRYYACLAGWNITPTCNTKLSPNDRQVCSV